MPVARTKKAMEEFASIAQSDAFELMCVVDDGRTRFVIAGAVERLETSWLAIHVPDHHALGIALDEIKAWSKYDHRKKGALLDVAKPWVRAGAVIHPWMPRAAELQSAAFERPIPLR